MDRLHNGAADDAKDSTKVAGQSAVVAVAESHSPQTVNVRSGLLSNVPELTDILSKLYLPDPPDNPKPSHQTSRCVFPGGHVDSDSLERSFLAISQCAARLLRQSADASGGEFVESSWSC
jgi:hypothetical protein